MTRKQIQALWTATPENLTIGSYAAIRGGRVGRIVYVGTKRVALIVGDSRRRTWKTYKDLIPLYQSPSGKWAYPPCWCPLKRTRR